MGSAPSPPPAPDPYKVADAQGIQNRLAAIDQSRLNAVNQITPYGSVIFTEQQVPGSQVPAFYAKTTLSPGMQSLFNSNLANSQNTSKLEGSLLSNAQNTIAKPLDLSYGATEEKLNQLGHNTLDPQFAQQRLQLNQQLANQGLTPGSEGWNYAQKAFGMNQADAYNDLYLRGHQQAISDITNQYNSPINTLSALRSNTQVSQPGVGALAPTVPSQINPPNLEGDVFNAYQGQLSAYNTQSASNNAMMGGLFGLGGQLLGSIGGMVSDKEMKTDVTPLGKDPETGIPVSAYRYKGDPKSYPKVVGPMAQDVEKAAPGSTTKVGGRMVIRPGFGIGGNK